MNAREQILKAITVSKPDQVELPILDLNKVIRYDHLPTQFKSVLLSIGATAKEFDNLNEIQKYISEQEKFGLRIANLTLDTQDRYSHLKALELESIETSYILGTLGVAENGSIWISESQAVNRLLPFICQHLVLILEKEKIVASMHQAYDLIGKYNQGFGLFIAGPSKTADIEQSLVTGAHGARSLTVFLY